MSRELFGKYIFTAILVSELGPPCWKKLEGGEGGTTKC